MKVNNFNVSCIFALVLFLTILPKKARCDMSANWDHSISSTVTMSDSFLESKQHKHRRTKLDFRSWRLYVKNKENKNDNVLRRQRFHPKYIPPMGVAICMRGGSGSGMSGGSSSSKFQVCADPNILPPMKLKCSNVDFLYST